MKEFARKLRKNQSRAEIVLWQRLRNRQLGFKFRRQHPIDRYIVDFVCIEKKVIIELDGEFHADQANNDLERQRFLESLGYLVIRYWTREFFEDLEPKLENLYEALAQRP